MNEAANIKVEPFRAFIYINVYVHFTVFPIHFFKYTVEKEWQDFKYYINEPHKLYSPPNIIRMIK
jgi:hypothetical protein